MTCPGGPLAVASRNASHTVRADGLVNVRATVEPDADGDGFGDETQDACPSKAGHARHRGARGHSTRQR